MIFIIASMALIAKYDKEWGGDRILIKNSCKTLLLNFNFYPALLSYRNPDGAVL